MFFLMQFGYKANKYKIKRVNRKFAMYRDMNLFVQFSS